MNGTDSDFLFAVFQSMVRQGALSALLLSFSFVDFFLINTGVHISLDPMHYFLPRCRWFLSRFFLLFLCLVYPFFFSGILWFLYVTHRAPGRMRESSYPTLAHEPSEKVRCNTPLQPRRWNHRSPAVAMKVASTHPNQRSRAPYL